MGRQGRLAFSTMAGGDRILGEYTPPAPKPGGPKMAKGQLPGSAGAGTRGRGGGAGFGQAPHGIGHRPRVVKQKPGDPQPLSGGAANQRFPPAPRGI